MIHDRIIFILFSYKQFFPTAKMSFDPADLENTSIDDLEEKQINVLNDWIKSFEEKKGYPIVGRLKK